MYWTDPTFLSFEWFWVHWTYLDDLLIFFFEKQVLHRDKTNPFSFILLRGRPYKTSRSWGRGSIIEWRQIWTTPYHKFTKDVATSRYKFYYIKRGLLVEVKEYRKKSVMHIYVYLKLTMIIILCFTYSCLCHFLAYNSSNDLMIATPCYRYRTTWRFYGSLSLDRIKI